MTKAESWESISSETAGSGPNFSLTVKRTVTLSFSLTNTWSLSGSAAVGPLTPAEIIVGGVKSNRIALPDRSPDLFPALSVSVIVTGLDTSGSEPAALYLKTYFSPDDRSSSFVSSRGSAATFTDTSGGFASSSLASNETVAVAPFLIAGGSTAASPTSVGATESMFSVLTHLPMLALHAQPEGQSASDLHASCAAPGTDKSDEQAQNTHARTATAARTCLPESISLPPSGFRTGPVTEREAVGSQHMTAAQ